MFWGERVAYVADPEDNPSHWPLPRHPDAKRAYSDREPSWCSGRAQTDWAQETPAVSSADRAFASGALSGSCHHSVLSVAPDVPQLNGQAPNPASQRPIRIRGQRQADVAGHLLGHLADRQTVGRHVLAETRILKRPQRAG